MGTSIRHTNRKGTVGQKERFKDSRHDPYREREKWPDGTVCPVCGARYEGGRWTWNRGDEVTQHVECPACQRISKNDPAGFATLEGPFFVEHREEIMRLVDNIEEAEKSERPLERIASVDEDGDTTLITTTGIHLPRRIVDAIFSAFEGERTLDYGDGEYQLRAYWKR